MMMIRNEKVREFVSSLDTLRIPRPSCDVLDELEREFDDVTALVDKADELEGEVANREDQLRQVNADHDYAQQELADLIGELTSLKPAEDDPPEVAEVLEEVHRIAAALAEFSAEQLSYRYLA